MTSKELREILTQTIDDRPREGRQYFHVCWWNDGLCCLPTMHTTEKHDIFFMAPDTVLDAGLSERQMELIGERVTDFCSRRRIRLTQIRRRPVPASGPSAQQGLQITDFDRARLQTLPGQLDRHDASRRKEAARLQMLLKKADVVPSREIPQDVVTLNSKVRVKDGRNNRSMVLSLAFPTETPSKETTDEENVSILSRVGLSLLGRRVGEQIDGRMKVDELLYQPEAAGDYHL